MAESWFKHMTPRGRVANPDYASLSPGVREFMEAILDDKDPRRAMLRAANATEESPPSAGQLFAEAVLENPPRRQAVPAAGITTETSASKAAQEFADALLGRPAQVDTREFLAQVSTLHEGTWDSSKHPRGGFPQNPGQFSPTVGAGTGGSVSGGSRSGVDSYLDRIIQLNSLAAELTGGLTPEMIRANRRAIDLQSKLRLPGEMVRAGLSGLFTGGKAVVNGTATAIKNVATLGLSTSQLELIGVTKEDRDRGYDTAVAISTASGQMLIAVGTGGIASVLSKGGTVAKTASGAFLSFDAAGNAVGVVQGVVDATQNRVDIRNGAQIAGGLLGLGANAAAVKGLITPRTQIRVPNTLFRLGKHGEMPTPRPGQHSHHGVMSAWMERTFSHYDHNKAPAILMPEANHLATFGVYRKWRAEMARKTGGTFDWAKVTEADMRALSEKMFDAAQVPSSIRQQYWAEFEKMKAALR